MIGSQVTVTTSATLLAQADSDGGFAGVRNAGTVSIFLGGSGVTTAGAELPAGGTVSVGLGPAESVYGIVASGSAVTNVLVGSSNSSVAFGGGSVSVSPTVAASAPLNVRKTVTTAGTAVALNGSALVVRKALITALSTNTGVIVPGGSGVLAASGSRNGPYLNAGDTLVLESVDLSTVYIDSTVNGEGVTVLYQV